MVFKLSLQVLVQVGPSEPHYKLNRGVGAAKAKECEQEFRQILAAGHCARGVKP